jgi:hypothetical protein
MLMGQKGFVSNADAALSNLIWDSLQKESAAEKIISSQEQISFSTPKPASTRGNRKLSIFLYNITEETAAKNIPPPEDGSGRLAPRMSFAMHYLLTPLTGDEKDDHGLLEEIIQILLTKPLFGLAGAESNIELSVKIDSLSLDELSRLWMALDTPLRLSVSITVSSAESLRIPQRQVIDGVAVPHTPEIDANRVTQLYQAVLKTFTDQSTGWRNRNMFVKQWIHQDFQKNSGITVEEMQSMLSSLGDKLEHDESTVQSITPLNQLAGYYTHQLDELKGLQKVTHKQAENIETITLWIRDVKALVEELTR